MPDQSLLSLQVRPGHPDFLDLPWTFPLVDALAAGLKAGANVRGVAIGRSVLFAAGAEDPAAVAHAIEALVHDGVDARTAMLRLAEARGSEQDWLLKLFP